MTIPTLGGLIWHPLWNVPGEGPYSIVAKLIHANAISASRLKEVICWKGTEGSNLLMPKPKQSLNERNASLARLIHDSSLFSFLQYQYVRLADDQTLRYCRTCMSTGFQAAIAQIEGFDECPIHKEPHLSICERCGASTPTYFLGDKGRFPRFSCRKCGFPFGGSVLIERRLDAWRPPDHLYRLDSIHQWLKKVNDNQWISWSNMSQWETTRFLEDGEDQYRRRAKFAVFGALLPSPIIPIPKSVSNIKIFGPFPFKNGFVQPSKHRSVRSYHIARRLPWGCKFNDYRQKFRMPSFGVLVPDDPTVPPSIHAKLIFHAQFESLTSITDDWGFSNLFSNKSIMGLLDKFAPISSKIFEDETFVRAILEATLLAAERIANEWHHLLLGMCRSDSVQFNESWLTACNRWSSRLGRWRTHGYFPVGLVKVRDSKSWEQNVYLVVG